MKKYGIVFIIWLFYFACIGITLYLYTERLWSSVVKGLFLSIICLIVTYLFWTACKRKVNIKDNLPPMKGG